MAEDDIGPHGLELHIHKASGMLDAAQKLVDKVTFDMIGENGRGGNGGLISISTMRACDELRTIINRVTGAEEEEKAAGASPRRQE